MSNLFISKSFTSHSGLALDWKIDCDALTDEDIATIAMVIAKHVPAFGNVRGIPRGGNRLKMALYQYESKTSTHLLLVDDVLTTGRSMELERAKFSCPVHGAVIFSRGPCQDWVWPVFQTKEGV